MNLDLWYSRFMDQPPLLADELRDYAAGDMSWAVLRARGIGYADVLAGLGELGLRPPLAPMAGPNLAARQRGVDKLRELLNQPRP